MSQTRSAYNRAAPAYEDKFSSYGPYLRQIDLFESRLENGSRILDLGCGPGLNARRFTDRGHRVTGLDFSASMIERARRNCPEGRFIHAPVSELPEGEAFDALCLSFVIVHLKDDEYCRLLDNILPLCRKGALLYLSFMKGEGRGYERTSFSRDEIFFNYYDPEKVEKDLQDRGFSLVDHGIEPYPESDGTVSEDHFVTALWSGAEGEGR